MYIVLESGAHEVRAVLEVGEDFSQTCPCLSYLKDECGKDRVIKGFHALFKRYAEGGRAKMTAESFHEVDKNQSIWEFVKGDHRVFCFVDGSAVVLTHAARKKSQKVDQSEVAKSVRAKTGYFERKGKK